VIANDFDHRLDGVGRLDGFKQRPGDPEPSTVRVASHPSRKLTAAPGCFVARLRARLPGRLGLDGSGLAQAARSLRYTSWRSVSGEMIQDVSLLVSSASLDDGFTAVHVRMAQAVRLAAIDDEQHTGGGVQPTLGQISG
jgi:hypothetical protein